jgi:hypothetical protein
VVAVMKGKPVRLRVSPTHWMRLVLVGYFNTHRSAKQEITKKKHQHTQCADPSAAGSQRLAHTCPQAALDFPNGCLDA